MDLKNYIRTIPDFPKPGIQFRDVTTLFSDRTGFNGAVDALAARFSDASFDQIVGLEARGFVLGAALAQKLGLGMTLIRKAGKLPGETLRQDYELEYGQAVLEIHTDALMPGQKIILIDDLLATGGTAAAGVSLLDQLGAEIVGCGFVIDLPELGGRKRLEKNGLRVEALVAYEGE